MVLICVLFRICSTFLFFSLIVCEVSSAIEDVLSCLSVFFGRVNENYSIFHHLFSCSFSSYSSVPLPFFINNNIHTTIDKGILEHPDSDEKNQMIKSFAQQFQRFFIFIFVFFVFFYVFVHLLTRRTTTNDFQDKHNKEN